jgi:bifunctional UDP-N-acetylglucosamine pyrophosphorylase/glucosamine-1-phosphate N-acetyltransferase
MKSSTPKVLHKICGKPIVMYVIDAVRQLKPENIIVVIGPPDTESSNEIQNALKKYSATFAVQREPKGTADALKSAVKHLKGFNGTMLVLNGDTPLITVESLQKFLRLHKQRQEDLSVMSFIAEGIHSYGRIIRENGKPTAIIEDKDADENQKNIKEVNSGIYAIESGLLNLLKDIKINAKKGEYYLTDILDMAVKKGFRAGAHALGNETELTGINTRQELCKAAHYLRDKTLNKLFHEGVSFIDSGSTFIHPDVKIGIDTVIYPNVHIEGNTIIGNNCVLFPGTRITDSIIENNVVIKDYTIVESSTISDKAAVGPFAHIRPGSLIGRSVKIGNFVEIKKSTIGEGTKASHLSYLGDAEIGKNVNIGAGTITCNYNGKKKHRTIIEDDVFVGSDTQLIAPVRVEKGAYIGAGSTITKNVPPGSLAISRTRQRNIEEWAVKKTAEDEKMRR